MTSKKHEGLLMKIYLFQLFNLTNLFPEGTDIHIKQHSHKKDLNLCLSLYYYGKIIVVELENNTNKEFNCIYVFVI